MTLFDIYILLPVLDRSLIDMNIATRIGRGTYYRINGICNGKLSIINSYKVYLKWDNYYNLLKKY